MMISNHSLDSERLYVHPKWRTPDKWGTYLEWFNKMYPKQPVIVQQQMEKLKPAVVEEKEPDDDDHDDDDES